MGFCPWGHKKSDMTERLTYFNFISLSIICSEFVYVVVYIQNFLPFEDGNNIHCAYTTFYFYPFICWWTFGLYPPFAYREKCCWEHWCTHFLKEADLITYLASIARS